MTVCPFASVDDRRHPAIGRNFQKIGRELVAATDVDRLDRVGKPELLEKNDGLLAVSGRPEIQVDHRVSSGSEVKEC
jgi:hypothetical protein